MSMSTIFHEPPFSSGILQQGLITQYCWLVISPVNPPRKPSDNHLWQWETIHTGMFELEHHRTTRGFSGKPRLLNGRVRIATPKKSRVTSPFSINIPWNHHVWLVNYGLNPLLVGEIPPPAPVWHPCFGTEFRAALWMPHGAHSRNLLGQILVKHASVTHFLGKFPKRSSIYPLVN